MACLILNNSVNLNMATLTVQIDKERDLPALHALLDRLGLEYQVEDDDWGGLPEEAIEGLKAGIADADAGRVYTHEEVMSRIANKLKELGLNK
jgi:predicted transcriptional regulator